MNQFLSLFSIAVSEREMSPETASRCGTRRRRHRYSLRIVCDFVRVVTAALTFFRRMIDNATAVTITPALAFCVRYSD